MKSERKKTKVNDHELFWHWFSENADKIACNPEDAGLICELDRRVGIEWPDLAWEIGPDDSGGWYFALSPNLNRELVDLAKEAIKLAPLTKGWSFYAARQRKVWDGRFEFESKNGLIQIDSSNWRYVLLRYPNGDHEVLLFGDDAKSLDEDDRWRAAAIVMEGILGEECLLAKVAAFTLEVAPDKAFIGKDMPLQQLPQAFGI